MIAPGIGREADPDDRDAVGELLRAAFGRPDESELVERLRAEGAMAAEFVTPWGDRIAAYAGLSRMRAPRGWLCLAPLAVHPDFQGVGPDGRRGRFGSRLAAALAEAAQGGEAPPIVVLGSVTFYERAGFSAERAARLRTPYPVEHTLLSGLGTDAPEAELRYPAAFGA